MYKNQLQELAQRSCFNLPAYACIREGPDHAPRFKATVNFNGEIFESPSYCSTLRQAEHAAAEVALNTLSRRGPSQSLAARILDETSVCKNLLQETAQRAGVSLPAYSTTRSGPGHLPVFTSVVEVAGLTFTGEAAKTKKQAEKNAAMAAWSALKLLANQGNSTSTIFDPEVSEEQEQNTIAKALAKAHGKEDTLALVPFRPHLQHSNRSHMQRYLTSSPSRSRLTSNGRESRGSAVLAASKQYHPGNWLPGDLSLEPVQSAAHGYLYNQPHSNMIMPGGLPYPSVTAYPGQVSAPGSMHYHFSGLSREAITANRAVAAGSSSNANRVIPTQLRTVTTAVKVDRHEVPIPTKEHQQDEDEWLHGGSVKLSTGEADFQGSSRAHLASSSHNSYSSMWSHPSDPWWSYHPSPSSFVSGHKLPTGASVAPPVRVRTVTAVCAAPPPTGASVAPPVRVRTVTAVCAAPPPTGASVAPPVRERTVTAVCAAPPRASSHQWEPERGTSSDPTGEKDVTCEVFNQLRI